jgi:CheY-like chemotaxis protein
MSEKARILVVDNDPDMVEQLTSLLVSEGYEVVQAFSRAEAEEVLLSVRPDLAILDLMMEQMDSGFVLAHHLQKLYPKTPAILLTAVTPATGLSFSGQSAEAQSWLNVAQVMDKPVRPDQLKEAVRRLLQQAH